MRRPTFCSSLDDQPSPSTGPPSEKEKESRLSRVKRMLTDSILVGRRRKDADAEKENSGGGVSVCVRKECVHGETLKEVHIEVSSTATTEIVLKPRKRKERLDSGGSSKTDTKVIRSNSEERPESKPDANVRRVCSHDELKKLAQTNIPELSDEHVIAVVKIEPLDIGEPCRSENINESVAAGDLEALRSSERFARSRCAAPRRRKVSRRAPPPHVDRSPSPDKLDVSSLHKQIEGSEPLTSRGKILSPDDEPESPAVEALISPRNSLVMRLEYLDPTLPPSPPQLHLHALRQNDKKERRMLKQINGIKKQLRRYDEGFCTEFGYRPSQADKMANKDIKRLMSDLSRLKIQLKQLRDELPEMPPAATEELVEVLAESPTKVANTNKNIEEVLQDLNKRLKEKRVSCGRSKEIGELTDDQIVEEKLAVQKALLTLENTFGRPVVQKDRDLVRPLYQRYRALKRLVVRSNPGKLSNSAGELPTILEHETMEFSPSASVEVPEEEEGLVCGLAPETLHEEIGDDTGPSSSSSDSLGENLHALPLYQLLEQQKRLKEEKKKLRRSLREFEENFQTETGRRAQKQDRLVIETIYLGYKQAKAKLRLIEALIVKKSQVKRNSC